MSTTEPTLARFQWFKWQSTQTSPMFIKEFSPKTYPIFQPFLKMSQEQKFQWGDRQVERNCTMFTKIEGIDVNIVGTAHVSSTSKETVEAMVHSTQPDALVLELDGDRVQAMMVAPKDTKMEIDTNGNIMLYLVNKMVKLLVAQLEAKELGGEFRSALQFATAKRKFTFLADRPIGVTFSRLWSLMPLWEKVMTTFALLKYIVWPEKVTMNDVEGQKTEQESLSVLDTLARKLPTAHRVLVDERNKMMASCVRFACSVVQQSESTSRQPSVLVVVGFHHMIGIMSCLEERESPEEMNEILTEPQKKSFILPLVVSSAALMTSLAAILYLRKFR